MKGGGGRESGSRKWRGDREEPRRQHFNHPPELFPPRGGGPRPLSRGIAGTYQGGTLGGEYLPDGFRAFLAALLTVLQERDRAFIVHRMGPHECEGVAGGTAQELRSTRCVEVCGDNVVERLALDLDEWPEVWPSDDPAPVLVITIGGKEAKP